MNTYAEKNTIKNLLSMKSKKKIKKGGYIIDFYKNQATKDNVYMMLEGEALLEVNNFDGNLFYSLNTSNQVFGLESLLLEKKKK